MFIVNTVPIWFASVPTPPGQLDPYFILTFAGMSFCCIFIPLTFFDIYRNRTSFAEIRAFSTWSFLRRCALIGFCDALNGLFLVYAAPPNRTPPFLQAILGTFNIGWTILFRAVILRKYPSRMQSVWAGAVFVGLFLSSCPSIFGLAAGSSFESQAVGPWKVLWPIIFASSFAPAAIMNVVGESVLQQTSQIHAGPGNRNAVNIWYYLSLQSLSQLLTFLLCFWVSTIPHFGTVHTVDGLFSTLKMNWRFFFAMDGASWKCSLRAMVFVSCYVC